MTVQELRTKLNAMIQADEVVSNANVFNNAGYELEDVEVDGSDLILIFDDEE